MKTSICKTCNENFIVKAGSRGIYCSPKCAATGNAELTRNRAYLVRLEKEALYVENPNNCKNFHEILTYENRKNTFCCSSCAASFNNSKRSDESRQKQQDSISKTMDIKYPNRKPKKAKQQKPKKIKVNTKKLKIYPIKITCQQCFHIFDSYSQNRIYCSVKCKCDSQIRARTEYNKNKAEYNKNKAECINCGKDLEYDKRNRKTCCQQCNNQYNSKRQTAYLKNPINRKKYKGNGAPSYMESSFKKWLLENKIPNDRNGFLTELHFFNKITKKHGWVDFIFPKLKIIIELDGNHHRYRKELDNNRDDYLRSKGYNVIRITHKEYVNQLRYHEICKLLNVLPCPPDSNRDQQI